MLPFHTKNQMHFLLWRLSFWPILGEWRFDIGQSREMNLANYFIDHLRISQRRGKYFFSNNLLDQET